MVAQGRPRLHVDPFSASCHRCLLDVPLDACESPIEPGSEMIVLSEPPPAGKCPRPFRLCHHRAVPPSGGATALFGSLPNETHPTHLLPSDHEEIFSSMQSVNLYRSFAVDKADRRLICKTRTAHVNGSLCEVFLQYRYIKGMDDFCETKTEKKWYKHQQNLQASEIDVSAESPRNRQSGS